MPILGKGYVCCRASVMERPAVKSPLFDLQIPSLIYDQTLIADRSASDADNIHWICCRPTAIDTPGTPFHPYGHSATRVGLIAG